MTLFDLRIVILVSYALQMGHCGASWREIHMYKGKNDTDSERAIQKEEQKG